MAEKDELEFIKLAKDILFKKAQAIKAEHADWTVSKCILEAAKKLEEEPKPAEPTEPAKEPEPETKPEEPKPELQEEPKKKPEKKPEPEPEKKKEPEKEEAKPEPKKEECDHKAQIESLTEKNERLIEELEIIRNRGIKVTRQPEELAKKTGSTTKYFIQKDGSIFSWDWVK